MNTKIFRLEAYIYSAEGVFSFKWIEGSCQTLPRRLHHF
jgi:hypothetical protein